MTGFFSWQAFLAVLAVVALATRSYAQPTPDFPSSRSQVAAALERVRKEYGTHAVSLQSHLLQNVIQGGSLLAASVAVTGLEDYGGKRYLAFDLETGIVYQDETVSAAQRPERIWIDVVEPTLRQFDHLDIPADGLALQVKYQHARYADRNDLQQALREGQVETDIATFRLLASDASDLVHARITAPELLSRSPVLVNGRATRLNVPMEASAASPAR